MNILMQTVIPVSTDDKYVDMAASPVAVTLCRNGSYCCGNGTLADACCTMDQGLFVVNGSATQRNPAFTVASPTATFSESSSSLTPPASYPAQKSARETGTIVGGTIGGVALLALCVSIWKFLDRRKPQGHENEVVQTHAVSCPSTLSGPQDEENLHEPFEVHEDTEIREIDGAEVIFQLDPSRTPASRASGKMLFLFSVRHCFSHLLFLDWFWLYPAHFVQCSWWLSSLGTLPWGFW